MSWICSIEKIEFVEEVARRVAVAELVSPTFGDSAVALALADTVLVEMRMGMYM